jgi:hypothetical protein
MFLVSQQSGRLLAASLSFCLALASIGPSVAIACEGGGAEPQKISLNPIEWSGEGKKCPLDGKGRVEFTKVNQWCEYEVKNENAVEQVKVKFVGIASEPPCEFGGGVFCFGFKAPKEKECQEGKTTLTAGGGKCFARVEYLKKPAIESEEIFVVKTVSEPGNAEKSTSIGQAAK